jgi:hypothetical protein
MVQAFVAVAAAVNDTRIPPGCPPAEIGFEVESANYCGRHEAVERSGARDAHRSASLTAVGASEPL